jgi:hypothetical protein
MLHAGLDLSRNRLDVCLLSDEASVDLGDLGAALFAAKSGSQAVLADPAP